MPLDVCLIPPNHVTEIAYMIRPEHDLTELVAGAEGFLHNYWCL